MAKKKKKTTNRTPKVAPVIPNGYPCVIYKGTLDLTVNGPDELAAAGPGWADHPSPEWVAKNKEHLQGNVGRM